MSLERRASGSRPRPTWSSRRARRILILAIAFSPIPIAGAQIAAAAEYYIDSSKADASDCGTAQKPCRTYAYWFASGCGGGGCGSKVAPGDAVYFRAGTYAGDGAGKPLAVPFRGTATSPIRVACVDAPGSCVITGSGVTPIQWCSLVGLGLQPGSSYCASSPANYVHFTGFQVRAVPRDMYGVLVSSQSHHVLIGNTSIDGAGSNHSPILVQEGTSFLTMKDNTVTNCPAADTGCTYINQATNFAQVGNAFGPGATSGNYDCNTLLGVQNGLVDGNTCTRSADGFDQGMHSSTKLQRVIIRYNRVTGTTSRAFPLSGDRKDSGVNTGENILYKNVAHPDSSGAQSRCFELYEGAEGIDIWNNTCFPSDNAGWGDGLWLNPRGDYQSFLVRNVRVGYNVFDTRSTKTNPLLVLDQDSKTVAGCPSSEPCKLIGNAIWMAERGESGQAIHWDPSDAPQSLLSCLQFASATMNTNGHAGNFRANPAFVDRAKPSALASLRLTPASAGYIDTGSAFCRATAAGSGNKITVACNGVTNDPRHYFPDPANMYALANDDCKGKGVRAADGVNPGCFDIQIQGACGVRTITAMTATSITFSGPSCSWTSGASVHIPWSGSAPDVGALELDLGGTAPRLPAPVLQSVERVN